MLPCPSEMKNLTVQPLDCQIFGSLKLVKLSFGDIVLPVKLREGEASEKPLRRNLVNGNLFLMTLCSNKDGVCFLLPAWVGRRGLFTCRHCWDTFIFLYLSDFWVFPQAHFIQVLRHTGFCEFWGFLESLLALASFLPNLVSSYGNSSHSILCFWPFLWHLTSMATATSFSPCLEV